MHSFCLRTFKKQRGAAVVEFVLVLPLLLLLLFGIIEFSLLMYNKHIITNASREGARFGIVVVGGGSRHSEAEIRDVVTSWSGDKLVTFGSGVLEPGDITFGYCDEESEDCSSSTATWDPTRTPGDNTDFGDKLRVRIEYQYDFLFVPQIPLLGSENNLSGDLTLEAETVMTYE